MVLQVRGQNPANWPRIERNIKLRADFRCECGSFYDCNGVHHHGRCVNVEGNRYVHNKRRIALRVVQIGPRDDWQPHNLVALCLPCYTRWQQRQAEKDADTTGLEQDGLFDHLHS